MIIGDQLTCKNIRSSKQWRQPEVNEKDRLRWAKEVPGIYIIFTVQSVMYTQVYIHVHLYIFISTNIGDFHFMWECLRVVFLLFWGKPAQPGSLCNLREVVRRVQVNKAVKVFNVGDEFLMHAFQAHLIAGILTVLQIENTSDPIHHPESAEWLKLKAQEVVTLLLFPQKSDDPVHQLHLSFLHHAFLYMDLREAVRWENGSEILRHWKWWLTRFLGTGRKNYASEAVYHICNLTADFPKHMAFLATHNRTVNMSGKPGQGKPVDQLIEHYNL